MIDFFSLPQEKKESTIKRFNSKIDKSDPNGCWMWQGSCSPQGYGAFIVCYNKKSKIYRAHRIAWMIQYNSPIPNGLICLHSCDTPGCVRASHIAIGTREQNAKDSSLKDRRAKVKLADRLKIAEAVYGGMSTEKVAKLYNIPPTRVLTYLKRKEIVDRYGKIDLSYRAIHNCGGRPRQSYPSLI